MSERLRPDASPMPLSYAQALKRANRINWQISSENLMMVAERSTAASWCPSHALTSSVNGSNGQWSVVSGQWSVVSGQWSVVSGQW
ncbi:hypothetical protein OMB55_00018840 [gamma proteobacterium HIMB55]|nr:hypothetical protein OMB55_00018840 [gamma proteobacterium HIMB55]